MLLAEFASKPPLDFNLRPGSLLASEAHGTASCRFATRPYKLAWPPCEEDFATGHPGLADVALAIEVADSSVATDRSTKQRLYATAGIPVYWLVNIPDSQVELFEQPDVATGKYQQSTIVSAGGVLKLALATGKDIDINVGELLR